MQKCILRESFRRNNTSSVWAVVWILITYAICLYNIVGYLVLIVTSHLFWHTLCKYVICVWEKRNNLSSVLFVCTEFFLSEQNIWQCDRHLHRGTHRQLPDYAVWFRYRQNRCNYSRQRRLQHQRAIQRWICADALSQKLLPWMPEGESVVYQLPEDSSVAGYIQTA